GPQSVKDAVAFIVEKVKSMFQKTTGSNDPAKPIAGVAPGSQPSVKAGAPPQENEGILQRTIHEVEKFIGKVADETKKFAEQAKAKFEEAKKFYDDHKGDIDKIK